MTPVFNFIISIQGKLRFAFELKDCLNPIPPHSFVACEMAPCRFLLLEQQSWQELHELHRAFGSGFAQFRFDDQGDSGSPKFPGHPHATLPCSWIPVESHCTCPYAQHDAVPPGSRRKTSTMNKVSGFDHTAL